MVDSAAVTLLNIKGFSQRCHRRPVLVSPKNTSVNNSSMKNVFLSCSTFSTIKNLVCNGKVPLMLKVLYGTIDSIKQTLFIRVYVITFWPKSKENKKKSDYFDK